MGYTPEDLQVKANSHALYSRYAALEACAQSLVAAAKLGAVRPEWVVPFVRGVLKFDNTHGYRLEPLDMLVWCADHPEPPTALFSYAMNLVDPPQASEPAEVPANAEVCVRFLLSLAGADHGYFSEKRG